MPVGKKKSPAKFIGAVSLGLGVIKGATSIIGGMQERRRLREENRIAQQQYEGMRDDIKSLEITNPYKDLPTTFENTFEDLTVNQQQAQFEAQQGAQARANLLSNLQGAAGGSGIAGLAQALANQQQVQGQQISASIGQQEAANQAAAAQQGANIQMAQAEGAAAIQDKEQARTETLLGMSQQRLSAANEARAQATQQLVQGIGSTVMGGIGAAGGLEGVQNFLGITGP